MKFSFVIPAYNNWAGLHQLLWDIYKNCSIPDEVIIMDDDSPDPAFLTGLSWWMEQDMLPIKHVRNMDNMGFLLNSNKGLRMAMGDIVCLVSTDVRIHKDVTKLPEMDGVWGGRYLDWDTGWNTFGKRVFPYLEGWFLLTSKKIWKDIGYFDESFAPNDFEDVDISTTALSKGYRLNCFAEGYVFHVGAQTIGYNPEREALTVRNRKKFEDKWVKKVKAS